MFIVERYINNQWIVASSHTQEVDRDRQLLLFMAANIPAEDLRKSLQ